MTDFHVLVGTFKDSLKKAPWADINVLALGPVVFPSVGYEKYGI